MPHYLAGAEWAEGALAALNAIVDVTGLNLPNDDLVAAGPRQPQAIAAEVDGNDEARAVVSGAGAAVRHVHRGPAAAEPARHRGLAAAVGRRARRGLREVPARRDDDEQADRRLSRPLQDVQLRTGAVRCAGDGSCVTAGRPARAQSLASDQRAMTEVSATNRTGAPPAHRRGASSSARSTPRRHLVGVLGRRVHQQLVVQAQHDLRARGRASCARTVAAHALNSSAAAPWMIALRANRPRAASSAGSAPTGHAARKRRSG